MKRKPKSYKAGSRPGSVIKIFCGSMHPTLCGSPNISLTRRSPPLPERETKFSKIWIQRKPKSYKTESRPGSVQYITSPQNILWICALRPVWVGKYELDEGRDWIISRRSDHLHRDMFTNSNLFYREFWSPSQPSVLSLEVIQCLGPSLYWYILIIFQSNMPIIVTLWQWTTSLFWKS